MVSIISTEEVKDSIQRRRDGERRKYETEIKTNIENRTAKESK